MKGGWKGAPIVDRSAPAVVAPSDRMRRETDIRGPAARHCGPTDQLSYSPMKLMRPDITRVVLLYWPV